MISTLPSTSALAASLHSHTVLANSNHSFLFSEEAPGACRVNTEKPNAHRHVSFSSRPRACHEVTVPSSPAVEGEGRCIVAHGLWQRPLHGRALKPCIQSFVFHVPLFSFACHPDEQNPAEASEALGAGEATTWREPGCLDDFVEQRCLSPFTDPG